MVDEMRLPIFRGDGSEDPDKHWFLCEAVCIKQVTDEAVKRNHFSNTLRDRALNWYMKFSLGPGQPKPLNDIKTTLSVKFKKPKLESQCITELKEIKKKVTEPIWEFDHKLKTLIGVGRNNIISIFTSCLHRVFKFSLLVTTFFIKRHLLLVAFYVSTFRFCFHDCKHENSQLEFMFDFIKGLMFIWSIVKLSYFAMNMVVFMVINPWS